MELPSSLTRNAVINTFRKISPVAWEKLFEREDQNGIGNLRVSGDYPKRAYYATDGLIQWLVRNNRYSVDEIRHITTPSQPAAVRTHVLAG